MKKFDLKAVLADSRARAGAVLTGGFAAMSAHAQSAGVTPPDVTEVVSYINGLWAPIALVAGALLTIHFGIKGYKMLRRV